MAAHVAFGLSLAAFLWPVMAWNRADRAARREEQEQREERKQRAARRVRKW